MEQRKADRDVEQVKARRVRDRERMDQGLITNPKDLERMQHELTSLERRITALEDEELEVMERHEAAQTEATVAVRARDDHAARLGELRSARDAKLAAISEERDGVVQGRPAIVADLSAELLALYDRIRAHSGTGAAPLQQRRCGGCRLEVNAVDLGRFRTAAEDEVLRCEECGRILVRMPESGL